MIETKADDSDGLIIRTDLIQALLEHQKYSNPMLELSQISRNVPETDSSPLNELEGISTAAQSRFCEDHGDDEGGVIGRFVRDCPPLGVPAWAMEECLRVSPKAETWCGTTLCPRVWGPPGTAHCPFMTQPTDSLNFLMNE